MAVGTVPAADEVSPAVAAAPVLTLADIDPGALSAVLARFGLDLHRVGSGQAIPGSYWGESEAGLIGAQVFARADTPVHSILHEASHLLVMPEHRRAAVHTDATDSVAEEDAACYLQILLAAHLPGVGSARLMADMDTWGYTFRLGSAHAWFEGDAADAREFLCSQFPGIMNDALAAPALAPRDGAV